MPLSLEWYSLLLSLIKRTESSQKIIVCCADPQRIWAVRRELWLPFHLKKCGSSGWIVLPLSCKRSHWLQRYHLCEQPGICINNFRAIDRFLPGSWNPTDLIWISDYWECETLFAQGWPGENSALQLSVKSFLGELKRRKGKCKRSRCLVGLDLVRSFMFSCLSPGEIKLQVICQMNRGGLLRGPSPAVLRKCLLKDTSADLEWGDYSLVKQTTLK